MSEHDKKLKLELGGMTCANCALKIEKQLNKQPGVTKAVVNLGLGNAFISYNGQTIQTSDLIQSVEDLGYRANLSRIELQVEETITENQAAQINTSISNMEGVKSAHVNYKTGIAHVEYNSEEITPKIIINTMNKSISNLNICIHISLKFNIFIFF